MKTIDSLYNSLTKETRLITQTEMLLTERNNLVLVIEQLEKNHNKEIKRIRDKIKRINDCIKVNYKELNINN